MSESSNAEIEIVEEVLPDRPSSETPASGTLHPRRMLDRYEIIAEIAKGGMGTVFLARLSGAGGFERMMALKVMHDHLAEDETFVTMLLDEARTAAHIHHPNAVGITDVVQSPVGYYLVMDYVDGFPLSHILTHPEMSERDRIRVGTRLLVDAAQGLHAAHTAKNAKGVKLGIVHRDVSPQNVLVGRDGTGRIVDFGIALAASRVASSRPGTLKGKPQYMAPEQAKGEPCDGRTDVFALGIMLWETLTYERLFFGEMDVAVLVQVMECIVPSPRERNPNVPEALAAVALKALEKYPEDRYGSAREFAAALEKAAGESDLFASSAEVESLIGTLFAEEIAAKDEAIKNHLDRSVGDALPMRRGELSLVSKLFERKRNPKMRDMHTRTGQVDGAQAGRASTRTPASGVRSRGSIELAVAPTAAVLPTPPPAAERRGPSLALVSVAVLGALAILSLGAYALSTALNQPAEPVAATPPEGSTSASGDALSEASRGEGVSAAAEEPAAGAAVAGEAVAGEAVVGDAVVGAVAGAVAGGTAVEAASGAAPLPGPEASGSGRRRRPVETETPVVDPVPPPSTTPPPAGTGSGGSSPAFEANPYLGH